MTLLLLLLILIAYEHGLCVRSLIIETLEELGEISDAATCPTSCRGENPRVLGVFVVLVGAAWVNFNFFVLLYVERRKFGDASFRLVRGRDGRE